MRPSALPFLAQCPCWESDPNRGEDYKDAGTTRHDAFRDVLQSEKPEDDILSALDESDQESVKWAADYVKLHAPMSDYPLRTEFHVNPLDDQFKPIFENGGTLDVACGNHLFDLKSRERDYRAQMAAYALDMFQEHGWDTVVVHLLFTQTKRAVVYKFDGEAEARAIVDTVLANAKDPNRKPVICDYCGWCAKKLTCPAQLEGVRQVADAREDITAAQKLAFQAWLAAGAHTSTIDSAEVMGAVLTIARAVAHWCEAAEHRAKEMAIKQGVVAAGFKLQNRQGNRFISSVTDAFSRLGLPQEEFLKACEVKFSSACEAYSAFNNLKKSQGEKEVERKLGEALQRKATSVSLVAVKE